MITIYRWPVISLRSDQAWLRLFHFSAGISYIRIIPTRVFTSIFPNGIKLEFSNGTRVSTTRITFNKQAAKRGIIKRDFSRSFIDSFRTWAGWRLLVQPRRSFDWDGTLVAQRVLVAINGRGFFYAATYANNRCTEVVWCEVVWCHHSRDEHYKAAIKRDDKTASFPPRGGWKA